MITISSFDRFGEGQKGNSENKEEKKPESKVSSKINALIFCMKRNLFNYGRF